MLEWKRVEDELPKKNCEVILNTNSSKYGKEKLFADFYNGSFIRYKYPFNKENKYKITTDSKNTIEITHWAYINKPKEKK